MKDFRSGVSKVATVATVKNALNYNRWAFRSAVVYSFFPRLVRGFFSSLGNWSTMISALGLAGSSAQ